MNLKKFLLPAFLGIEAALYICILTTGGSLLIWSSFLSIVLCCAFAFFAGRNNWVRAGLVCTVGADFFLVLLGEKLPGMVFFLAAQTLYAIMLHRETPGKVFLWLRIGAVAAIEVITLTILGSKTDALALISVAYYVMLIVNLIQSFTKNKPLSLAFLLFLLCDTVIGLQVAAGGYLPIGADTLLYRILFMPFNLAWFFYLPSQVLIGIFGGNAPKTKAG